MGWFSSLFGKAKKAPALEPEPERAKSSQPTKSQARLEKSEARHTSNDSRVSTWVNWNTCGWIEVAGIQFRRKDALWAYKKAKEGDTFELERDPSNAHDANAIEVRFRGRHVGFIDRDLAALAATNFPSDMPIRAEFISGWHGESGYVRLTIQPLMPNAKSRKKNGWEIVTR